MSVRSFPITAKWGFGSTSFQAAELAARRDVDWKHARTLRNANDRAHAHAKFLAWREGARRENFTALNFLT